MENQLKDLNADMQFKNALVSELELTSGKHTQVIIAYNGADLNFEQINQSMNELLSRCDNILKMKSSMCAYRDGKLVPVVEFQEWTFKK